MSELKVPPLAENPFRAYYRSVLLDSLLRATDSEALSRRERGQTLRARRAERSVRRLRELLDLSADERPRRAAGPGIRIAVCLTWLVTVGLLAGALVSEGFYSWRTGAADLGVIVATFAWFFVPLDSDSPGHVQTAQLQLFEP